MVRHGIYPQLYFGEFSVNGNRTLIAGGIRYINVDSPKDFVEVPALGLGDDGGDKGPGKASSYLFKMANLKAFMLESSEPDNEHANAQHTAGDSPPRGAEAGGPSSSAPSPAPAPSSWDGSQPCRFGKKHKGTPWKDIEKGYLSWIIDNVDPNHEQYAAENQHVINCATQELARRGKLANAATQEVSRESSPSEADGPPADHPAAYRDEEDDLPF